MQNGALGILAVILVGWAGSARAEEAPVPAEMFFRGAEFLDPQLSPDGRRLGVLNRHDAQHYALSLLDLKSGGVQGLIKEPHVSVAGFAWKSDDLMVVSLTDDDGRWSVHVLDLGTAKVLKTPGHLVALLLDDPDAILLDTGAGLHRYDPRSGRKTLTEKRIGGISDWIVDAAGTAWAGIGFRERKWIFIWRSSPTAPWQRREQKNIYDAEIFPLAVTGDPQRLVVIDRSSAPTAGLAFFDLTSGALTPIFRHDQVDVTELRHWGFRGEPCAAIYHTDRLQHEFFLPEAEQCYRGLAAALPGEDFRLVNFTRDDRRAIAKTSGDRDPGKYYLVDRDSGKLSLLGAELPSLPPEKLAPTRAFQFKSRDGLHLTGRVTLPAGIVRPAVIVRLGPGLPGPVAYNYYDPAAQFFASRGLASVRIHVRGTAGFGRELRRAGDLQITTGMLNDLEDGLSWLAAQGWIDRERAALLGQSWGGVVALHAAARGGFRALVNFGTPTLAGAYQLSLLSPSDREEQELVALIGGSNDALQYLKTLDPLKAAEHLRVPSFHFYPRSRVGETMEDARLMKAALRKTGAPFTFDDPPAVRKDADLAKVTADRYEAAADFLRKELRPR